MGTQSWKWLLNQVSDQELASIAKALRLRVPGFKGTSWQRHWKAARAAVIQALLQPRQLAHLAEQLDCQVQQDSGLQELRAATAPELRRRLATGEAPARILQALLSSPTPEHVALADQLLPELRASVSQWPPGAGSADTPSKLRQLARLDDLERQLSVCQQAAELLKQEMTALTHELEAQRAQSEDDRHLWELERQSLLSRLADRDTRLQQLINRPSPEAVAADAAQPAVAVTSPVKVALVGNLGSVQLPATLGYALQWISPADLLQGLATAQIAEADEVWLLTYATPLPVRRRLLRAVPGKLRYFAAYEELLAFVEQEGKPGE